ncbi:RNA polymerase sigma factor [Gracilibacillus sp. YIM 98692]|uniref:RNA polymerase sigma factor n=1 Tax=Gracilibacillus sp. YIM 98692 TaxID=2663532 RepID=UPI0013CFA1AA|nr:RNA polymerase sigma factor [Gracilibacillus sp. YIM 98692]
MFKKFLKKAKPTEAEFRLLYEMFYSRVYRDVYFITRDSHLAQDALQETFVKAYNNMYRVEDKERIGAWLSTIATRTAIDYLRRRKGSSEILTEDMTHNDKYLSDYQWSSLEDMVEGNIMKEELFQKINQLKPEYREAILLKYIHELSINEMAQYLEMKESTVKTRLHRARNILKKDIEKDPKRSWIGGEIS